MDGIETTKDIKIPKDPLERIIGQEKAIEKVKIAIKQRRHLLLVGPPGIGKSMLAQALALKLPAPKEEVRVLHNPENPDRPILEIVKKEDIESVTEEERIEGEFVTPSSAPSFVAEQLGFRCHSCGVLSSPNDIMCPKCGSGKFSKSNVKSFSPFSDIITDIFDFSVRIPEREVAALKEDKEGNQTILIYQRVGDRIRVIDQKTIEKFKSLKEKKQMKILVPINRIPFVQATGASETELLGDVRHDPYGSHPEIGTQPYSRVIAGAIHEAHEGVLFVDELPHMADLQSFILTAMQNKNFPIIGRNPMSAGASVKVNNVPCDFVFVGACNIQDINKILNPLRSRILGNGYEILLETTMPDTKENRDRIAQFVTQEILIDGRIPHAKIDAIEEVVEEAKRKALVIDNTKNAITLRLRELGGLIRLAGDLAIFEKAEFIEKQHVKKALTECKPIEYQIKERYGSMFNGLEKDSVTENQSQNVRGYG